MSHPAVIQEEESALQTPFIIVGRVSYTTISTIGIYEGFTGKVIIKFVPIPGMFLTSIFPLCKSTMCFTIDNPRPVPPSFLDLDVSTT